MNTDAKIQFWMDESARARQVADTLFESAKYVEALFFGHLALEKFLKAKTIEVTKEEPAYSHDLVILAKHAQIDLTDDQRSILARVNVYNVRARYPDYRRSLHRKASRDFTKSELEAICKLIEELA